MMILLALFRAGTYVRFIPYPVTLGFTGGIAVIILGQPVERPVRVKPDRCGTR
ncbi:MAG: SulP family inorganic anion transporter [Cypionkella sp.]